MSEHKFPYRWFLKDGYPAQGIEPNGCNVFGTFVCGGGSTMGYKLAGYNHLGGVEIDPPIANVYKENHNPKYLFLEDIRVFNQREDLPDKLFKLDLLDGSPPCSSFSMAGNREKDWGKDKVFREGQSHQRLDDLVFVYIETIKKLQPKVAILENVKGLISGNAKAYVKKMKAEIEKAGYQVQMFLLNAASMGVPQKRERVFFICQRNNLKLPKLALNFNENAVLFKNIKFKDIGKPCEWKVKWIWDKIPFGSFSQVHPKQQYFGSIKVNPDDVCATIVSNTGSELFDYRENRHLSKEQISQVGTYPIDYNYLNVPFKYLIGMSVPPVMTAQIAHQIWLQWLSKITTVNP